MVPPLFMAPALISLLMRVSGDEPSVPSTICRKRKAEINASTSHPALPRGSSTTGSYAVASSNSSRSTSRCISLHQGNATKQRRKNDEAANHLLAFLGTHKPMVVLN